MINCRFVNVFMNDKRFKSINWPKIKRLSNIFFQGKCKNMLDQLFQQWQCSALLLSVKMSHLVTKTHSATSGKVISRKSLDRGPVYNSLEAPYPYSYSQLDLTSLLWKCVKMELRHLKYSENVWNYGITTFGILWNGWKWNYDIWDTLKMCENGIPKFEMFWKCVKLWNCDI